MRGRKRENEYNMETESNAKRNKDSEEDVNKEQKIRHLDQSVFLLL